jgi:hypothetical protein
MKVSLSVFTFIIFSVLSVNADDGAKNRDAENDKISGLIKKARKGDAEARYSPGNVQVIKGIGGVLHTIMIPKRWFVASLTIVMLLTVLPAVKLMVYQLDV